jgi:uncharacterized damage-inducible protein DinB
MEAFFEDYLDRLEAIHGEMEQALDDLPQMALDWAPGPEMNSFNILAVHVAGSQRWWIGDLVAGEPSDRVRESEFETRGLSESALKERLSASLNYCRDVLQKLTLEDLEAVRIAPVSGKEYRVGWCLAHALEHTALHLGHMQLTRQLWDQQTGA